MVRKKQGALTQVKNLARPFLNDAKGKAFEPQRTFRASKPFAANLQQIKKLINAENAKEILAYIEDNRLLPFDGLGNTFPKDRRRVPDSRLSAIAPLTFRREVILANMRILYHEDKLVLALTSLSAIDKCISASRYSEAIEGIHEHVGNFGLSVAVLKRSILCSYLQGGLAALPKEYKRQIDEDHHLVWNIIAHVYYDLCDPSFSVDRSIAAWRRSLLPLKKGRVWYAPIFNWELVGECYSEESLIESLTRYSSLSLLDLTLFLWQTQCISNPSSSLIVGKVGLTLTQNFGDSLILESNAYKDFDNKITDINVYRLTFFLRDHANLALIHNNISRPLFLSTAEVSSISESTSLTISRLGEDIVKDTSVDALNRGVEAWLSSNKIDVSQISSTTFIKALSVAHFVKSASFIHVVNEQAYCDNLCNGEGYHEHLSISLLRTRVGEAEAGNHDLLSFLIREAIYKKTRSADDDLERRAAFMAMFPPRKPAAIIEKIKLLHSWSPATSYFVARTCTRSFLERLFLIMTSLKDVLEVRLSITQWLMINDSKSAEQYEDERKAVSSELDNLDVRSDLDSTRVHVDEDALREWFVEHQFALVGRYTQTVLSEGPTRDREAFLAIHSRKVEAQRQEADEAFLSNIQVGSEYVLLNIVESTLKAFVSDRIFGLDAYLSRRIRHGTLSGFLLTPVGKIIFGENSQGVQDSGSPIIRTKDMDIIKDWHSDLSTTLDHARREIIQVQSPDHTEGLIEATWRSMSGVVHLDAVFSKVRAQVLRTNGRYDLFDDIYSLCWDLIERDLAKIRLFLLQDFLKPSLDRLDEGYRNLPFTQQMRLFSKFTDAKEVPKSRVQEVCGWFIRPVFRQDSYNIRNLVQSVVSIVRELDDKVDFLEQYDIEDGLEISRGAFEVAGDVLFVIIGNAAKHGSTGGVINIMAEEVEGAIPAIRITVNSFSDDENSFTDATNRIRQANSFASTQELEDASVQEGFSGIRKVILTLSRVSRGLARGQYMFEASSRKVSFAFVVPKQVDFRRSR